MDRIMLDFHYYLSMYNEEKYTREINRRDTYDCLSMMKDTRPDIPRHRPQTLC